MYYQVQFNLIIFLFSLNSIEQQKYYFSLYFKITVVLNLIAYFNRANLNNFFINSLNFYNLYHCH